MKRPRSAKNFIMRGLALAAACALLVDITSAVSPREAQAAKKTLTLKAAKAQAVANSDAYEKLEGKLATKQVSLSQAVRSIAEKKRNMSTFRWSPLLSFHFPEKPDLEDASGFTMKPIEIQAEIDTLNHQLTDQKLAEYETVSTLFVDIITAEKTIEFNQKRLDSMERTLEKNRARLKLGLAKQGDIDKMEKDSTSLRNKITSDTRTYENAKKKLGNKIGMDISTGYSFENAFLEADMNRSVLAQLKQYTLDRDQNYYKVCMDEQTALLALKTDYSLMQGQYGSKMNMISEYVRQAQSGEKINTKAFKSQYEQFLKIIDEPWQGKKKILFIKIPREWFKGQIDGIRYVEDEPYALYEAALEYQDALKEKTTTAADLEQQVEDNYNNYISMRNAYIACEEEVKKAEKQLEADEKLNILGELTYDEYKSSLDDFESLQQEAMDTLSAYSKTLYQFDRLTCGGVSDFLEGGSADLEAGGSGQSYVETEYAEGAYYSIEYLVQNQEFTIGVFIPDDLDVTVSHFELWCDNVQIGDRTAIDKRIRHLALAKDNINEAKIRFYNNGTFVDDCFIDPDVLSGPLDIVKSYTVKTNGDAELGTYSTEISTESGLTTLTLKLNAGTDIASYSIKNASGTKLISGDPVPIEKSFTYLSIIQADMSELAIEFYDKEGKLLCEAYFDPAHQRIMKNPEGQ